jgi:hypothetical protein
MSHQYSRNDVRGILGGELVRMKAYWVPNGHEIREVCVGPSCSIYDVYEL